MRSLCYHPFDNSGTRLTRAVPWSDRASTQRVSSNGNCLGIRLYVPKIKLHFLLSTRAVAELVGIEGGVVSGVINLESSGVEASDWRPRHDEQYHDA